MDKSLKTGGFVMGLVGTIVSLIAYLVIYIEMALYDSILFSVLILILGIIGSILGVIATSYTKGGRKFAVVMLCISAGMMLLAAVSTTVYYTIQGYSDVNGYSSGAVMTALPFTFIPDFLTIVASAFLVIEYKSSKEK